jgi:exodeoxyribonuclease V
MNMPAIWFSDDQAEAWDTAAEVLRGAGVDVTAALTMPKAEGPGGVLAILGKAGTGKTMLLAKLAEGLRDAGVDVVTGDYDYRKRRDRRTLAILAPTNKAASVLRNRGVPATTIHRILYTPVYDPQYEMLAEWLAEGGERPVIEGMTELALERAEAFFRAHRSIPGALAAAGLRGSDFIKGWKRREDPLDIGFVDESSMLDERQFDDLKEIFPVLVLFGDPAQLAPVNQSGAMVFDGMADDRKLRLEQVHRQAADNPILGLAHALADEALSFEAFERMVEDAARADPRVIVAERVDADLMARSPVLVWRNATRIRLIHAFRAAHGVAPTSFFPASPDLRRDRAAAQAPQAADRARGQGPREGRAGDLPRPRQEARLLAPAPDRGGGPAPVGRLHRQDRGPGRGRALHPLRGPHGRGVPARLGGDDPQGAGLAMGHGAGLRARPLRRLPGGAHRGRVCPCGSGSPMWRSRGPRNG